jgi:hypothetical protein
LWERFLAISSFAEANQRKVTIEVIHYKDPTFGGAPMKHQKPGKIIPI